MSEFDTARILTIDDEDMVRQSFRDFLEDCDYEVLEAENGRKGLEVFEREKPDLVMVDLRMPEVDGLDVLAKVSAISPATPIIVISGTGVIADVVEALRRGAWDYLLKPIEDLTVLEHAVEMALERARLIKENKEYQAGLENEVLARTKELRVTLDELKVSEAKYRSLIESTSEGYIRLSSVGRIDDANRSFLGMIGYEPEEVLGKDLYSFLDGHNRSLVALEIGRMASSAHRSFEFTIRARSGEAVIVLANATRLPGEEGLQGGCFALLSDITYRRRMENELRHKTLHDDLTGLANRTLCLERITRARERSREDHSMDLAVLFIDLDRFKMVNDTLGHEAGDTVLIETGRRLRDNVHELDTVSRFGDDEFVVVLEYEQNPKRVVQKIKQIREAIERPFTLKNKDGEKDVQLKASIGFAHGKGLGRDANEAVRNAHIAMHRAKEQGPGHMRVFLPRMLTHASQVMVLETDMERGIQNNEFFVVLQPIFAIDESHSLSGFEVLMRWNHPEQGLVMPGAFIPVAEDSGRIIELGAWVLKESCELVAEWLRLKPETAKLRFSVNVSPRQFSQVGFVQKVRKVLDEAGIPPEIIRLEITETALMQNAASAVNRLKELKALGITLSMDDFGTGYSNMSYLREFPLDSLKIDMSFVRKLGDTPEDVAVVNAIIQLAHSLGLKTVGEGVEDMDQLHSLYSLGCDYIQGYLLGRPMSREDAFVLIDQSTIL